MATAADFGNCVSIDDLEIDRDLYPRTPRRTSPRRPRSLTPDDRLRLRLLTARHRDRLGIEPATPEVIGAILDAHTIDNLEAAAR